MYLIKYFENDYLKKIIYYYFKFVRNVGKFSIESNDVHHALIFDKVVDIKTLNKIELYI